MAYIPFDSHGDWWTRLQHLYLLIGYAVQLVPGWPLRFAVWLRRAWAALHPTAGDEAVYEFERVTTITEKRKVTVRNQRAGD